jgi:hypothetical protein
MLPIPSLNQAPGLHLLNNNLPSRQITPPSSLPCAPLSISSRDNMSCSRSLISGRQPLSSSRRRPHPAKLRLATTRTCAVQHTTYLTYLPIAVRISPTSRQHHLDHSTRQTASQPAGHPSIHPSRTDGRRQQNRLPCALRAAPHPIAF